MLRHHLQRPSLTAEAHDQPRSRLRFLQSSGHPVRRGVLHLCADGFLAPLEAGSLQGPGLSPRCPPHPNSYLELNKANISK